MCSCEVLEVDNWGQGSSLCCNVSVTTQSTYDQTVLCNAELQAPQI